MTRSRGLFFAAALLLAVPGGAHAAGKGERVEVPAGIDHAAFDRLLAKYVDDRGLVDYAGWKASAEDREALAAYLRRFAAVGDAARGDDRAASLINAYNAFTISWLLAHYPIASIRSTSKPFDGRRHPVFGRNVSLDDIEHGSLRPEYGYRIHAAISCASLSCPPLTARTFGPQDLEERLDAAMRRWLAREDLNRYEPDRRRAEISAVFKWFSEDFEKAGGVRRVLARFGPESRRAFLSGSDYAIGYLAYDWGVNDQGGAGRDYGGLRSFWDKL
jgi:hypothetical protein